MKFRIYGMVLSLFFALGLVFSFSIEASSHEYGGYTHSVNTREASQVSPNDATQMEEFLRHSIMHLEWINSNFTGQEKQKEEIKFARELRASGVWINNQNSVYQIGLNKHGTITNHPVYPGLYGWSVGENPTDSLLSQLTAAGEKPVCVSYTDHTSTDRTACAMEYESSSGPVVGIAGFHHKETDSRIMPPDCTGLNITPTAKEVYESQDQEADLELFVKAAIAKFKEVNQRISEEALVDLGITTPRCLTLQETEDLSKAAGGRILGLAGCLATEEGNPSMQDGNFRHKSIYLFAMSPDQDGTVLVNGNSPNLNGLDFNRTDKENNNIGDLIREAVTGGSGNLADLADGNSDTVEYYWTNPDLMGSDLTEGWFENNLSPGTSFKKSYVEAVNLTPDIATTACGTPPFFFVFGSGVYPQDDDGDGGDGDSGGDDGACAIAGTSNTSQSTLLNLFLIASVLFSVGFLRRRI